MSAPMMKEAVAKGIQGRTIIAELPKKLAQRAVLAQRQIQRRKKRDDMVDNKRKYRYQDEVQKMIHAGHKQRIINERRWRREDWIMGPLAPRRDGLDSFGAVDLKSSQSVDKRNPKEYGIAKGDRVCIVNSRHREAGKIGRVVDVNPEQERVVIEGTNVADMYIPKHFVGKEADGDTIRGQPMPIPLSDVRLVAPLIDPETGKLKDTIINNLTMTKITRREKMGLDPPTRFVTALEPVQVIPYPPRADPAEAEEEFEGDTLRIEVDEKTWIPTLHMPPMPTPVLDELRNKYSKLRFRHDDEYIAKILKEDRKALKQSRKVNMMMTPLKQRRRIERKERKTLGRPEEDEGTLAAIGQLLESRLKVTESSVQTASA